MNCIKPIMLKSGILVPCGVCELCQSQIRTEKSVLVQLHTEAYETMPLFLTFTYADEHLNYGRCGHPTLCRPDLSEFIKKYKRDYSLTCDRLTYFGCGEYGSHDFTSRPHYHLIWFGDEKLHDLWLHDVHFAEDFMFENWSKGYVDVCEAQWSGIHYVTKYVLKDEQSCPEGCIKPFCVSSNGIGLVWLKSLKAAQIREKLRILCDNADDINSTIYIGDMDFNNPRERIDFLTKAVESLRPYVPDFRVTLPSGAKAYLPRKLRKRLVGSFEHFRDNPMWLYQVLNDMLETEKYLQVNQSYDCNHELSVAHQQRLLHIDQIRQRISKRNFNKSRV